MKRASLKLTRPRVVFHILAPYFKSNSRDEKDGAKTFRELGDYLSNMVMSEAYFGDFLGLKKQARKKGMFMKDEKSYIYTRIDL